MLAVDFIPSFAKNQIDGCIKKSLSDAHDDAMEKSDYMNKEQINSKIKKRKEFLREDVTNLDECAEIKGNYKYVKKEQLRQLRDYKYSAVDKSFISRFILSHYWNSCMIFCPRWISPNLITLIGFLGPLLGFICIIKYSPDLSSSGPSYLYYGLASAIWFYSTLDNIDGKQARRTNTNSPLGEIFDHTIDSLQCTIATFLQAACLGLGISKKTLILNNILISQFFISTWETHYTHTLFLDSVNGPTEGIILSCATFILSGLYGINIWNKKLCQLLPLSFWNFGPLSRIGNINIVSFVLFLISLFTFFTCLFNSICRVKKSLLHDPHLFRRSLVYLSSLGLLISSQWALFLSSKTISNNNPTLFYFLIISYGFIFSRIVLDMLVAHVTKSHTTNHFPILFSLFLPPFILSSSPLPPTFLEPTIFLLLLAFCVYHYFYRFWGVSGDMCRYLNINRFTIPHNNRH